MGVTPPSSQPTRRLVTVSLAQSYVRRHATPTTGIGEPSCQCVAQPGSSHRFSGPPIERCPFEGASEATEASLESRNGCPLRGRQRGCRLKSLTASRVSSLEWWCFDFESGGIQPILPLLFATIAMLRPFDVWPPGQGPSGCRLRHDCRFEATWLRQWREHQAELVHSQPGRNRYRCGHDDGLKKGDLSASDRHTMSWLRGRPRQASWRPKHRCFLSRFQEQPNLSTARDRGLQ